MIDNMASLTPLIILGGGILVLMLGIAIGRNHVAAFTISMLVMLGSFISIPLVQDALPASGTLMVMDGFGSFLTGFFNIAGILIGMMAYGFLNRLKEQKEEFYMLLLLSVLGASVLACSHHFVSFFLGLEILTVSLYVLIGYVRAVPRSVEASGKYLILAAASAAFLLFGIALLFARYGVMEFGGLGEAMASKELSYLGMTGMVLITVGVGFKLALVPFHLWTPDIYQGASSTVTALVASISKGSVVAILIRLFTATPLYESNVLIILLSVIAVASMLLGNILALLQRNVKRILAFSSIAHLGYLLVAFMAGGEQGKAAAVFYLVAYSFTIIGAFGIVDLLSFRDKEAEDIEQYQGLFWRKPVAAALLTIFMLSLAGIPLTAGFIGKFFVLSSGAMQELWFLSVVLVAGSVIGLYYYLRIVAAMFAEANTTIELPSLKGEKGLSKLALALTVAGVLVFGIYPAPLWELIKLVMI